MCECLVGWGSVHHGIPIYPTYRPHQPRLKEVGTPPYKRRFLAHAAFRAAVSRYEEKPEVNLPSYPNVDLFSAGVNALYGVLVARNPSHNRGYTAAGLLIMGYFGGIGGGVSRDVLLNEIPSPLLGVSYLIVCPLMSLLGLAIYRYLESKEERFRTRTLAYFKSFTLPWFAILGAHKALDHHVGIFGAILIGVIATNAGGVLIDLFSGVTPEIVRPSEQLVTASVLAGTVYSLLAVREMKSLTFFPVTLIAVLVAFLFRVFAVREHWPSIVPLAAPAAGPVSRA
jgi:uncharacterized membrane protein YeiH